VCKLTFEHMLEEPEAVYGEGISSNYQRQTSTLGKHFKRDEREHPEPLRGRAEPDDGDQLTLPVQPES
jgi:dCTP deaminase